MRGLDPRIHIPTKRIVAKTQSFVATWMDLRVKPQRR